ncbi:MAG: hypothetical protein HRT68_11955 [Flavobacteriaceae bacterium]|nr:hypothetical protein [Flavobacteriaceae bacterium]
MDFIKRAALPIIAILLTLVIILGIRLSNCENNIPNAEKPEGTITKDQANLLEETYKTERYAIIDSIIDYPDTREFVFKLNRLKQYIAYVESEASEMGYSDLGMRIYLGAYPIGFDGNEKVYTTLFLTPTSGSDPTLQGSMNRTFQINNNDHDGDDNIDGIDALNYGSGGMPPKDY